MSSAPRVSIGIAVYNGEQYLAATLDSLLGQTFPDFELLICDNASTDGTAEIGGDYAARDRRVRFVPGERNIGVARNFNRVFALSRGEYFRWFAGDDLAAPRSLERCVDVLDREPGVVLAYPKTRLIDAHGHALRNYEDGLHLQSPSPSERFRLLLERVGLCNAHYGLMRAAVMRRTGLMGAYTGSDVVFLAELTLSGTFWEIPEVLFLRRMHAGASSAKTVAERVAWYRPDAGTSGAGAESRYWRHLGALARAVWRGPVSRAEKARLAAYLLRTTAWNRAHLARELVGVVRRHVLPTRHVSP